MQNIRSHIFFYLVAFFAFLTTVGLEGQDRWKSYYSYKKCFEIEETNRFVVGATPLGLIYFHKETASISVKNKVNGLSDTGISTITYLPAINSLMVGYQNGNLDLVRDDKVTNIPDLKIESMTGSKRINHILYHNERVFCSTDFGILEIDINKKEIASTFIIGDEASSLIVYKTIVDQGYLFAATSSGVYRADLDEGRLTFYEEWELYSDDSDTYCDIERFSNGIVAMRGEPGSTASLELYRNNEVLDGGTYKKFNKLRLLDNHLLVISRNRIHWMDPDLSVFRTIEEVDQGGEDLYLPNYRDAFKASDGTFWFSDYDNGLMYEASGHVFHRVLPHGPYSNTVYSTAYSGKELWFMHGGFGALYDNAHIPAAVSVSRDGWWQSFNRNNTDEFKGARDAINAAVNPNNKNQVFVASWGHGLFEFRENQNENIYLRNHFKEGNSALQNVPGTPADRVTRIWGLAFDEGGHLYMSNSEVESSIVVYDTVDSTWHAYDYGSLSFEYNKNAEILIDDYGYKWLYIVGGSSKGIFVFDDRGTLSNQSDDRYRGRKRPADDQDGRNAGQMKLWDENGEEITNNIYSFAKDKNGYIWIGTDKGVVVQYNPSRVFDVTRPSFTRVKVSRNDGSGLADYLLGEEKVSAVAVDQANRKYFGTENAGVFLVSEDGTKTINHFNANNSPLPSDNISNITINDESGEIFFTTDEGVISYMGDAVKGNETFDFVYAYPNPVRPGYEGPITITGLVDRTNVKITDTSGNLVYETISLGGNAVWNGENLWGEKVEPGVYVVFLSSPEGDQSAYTKIAIIR